MTAIEERAAAINWGRWETPPPDDPRSGADPVTLFADLPAGSKANPGISVKVTGRPFHGLLANLGGVKATPSPVVYDAQGSAQSKVAGQQAYLVDFGVSISILGLEIIGSGAPSIVLVLPWLGTDFSPRALFPPSSAQPPVPRPDVSGDRSISLTGGETMKVLIQLKGSSIASADFPTRCRVTTGTYPANVRASLNGRLPFWTKPGPLRDTETVTGIVEDLNALLSTLTAPTKIMLTVTTDLPGVLKVEPTIPPGSIVHAARARWGGQDSTHVQLAALEPATVVLPFPASSGPPWQIAKLSLQLSGAFPAWRSYLGQATAEPGNFGMRVDANFGAARRIEFAQVASLFGVTLPLRPPASDAQIHLEVQADQAGLPAAGKPLAAADVVLPAEPGPAGGVTWHEVLLASPIPVKAGAGIWIVIKVKTGSVEWVGAPEPRAAQTRTVFAAEGGPWEDYPSLDGAAPVAQLRVLRRPFPAENTPLLDIAWSTPSGPAVPSEVGAPTTSVDMAAPAAHTPALSPSGGSVTVGLSVTARSSGTLTFKGASATYSEAGP